jgi:hypothetical protein
MTNVIATAMIEMVAVWRKMLRTLLPDRKPLSPSVMAKSRNTATKAM